MSTLTVSILASMLNVTPPGGSMYSYVPLKYCDETCQTTPLCDNKANWRCQKPKFRRELYEEFLTEFQKYMPLKEAQEEARFRSYTRPETKEEGFARYLMIARAISSVSENSTRHLCKQTCTDEDTLETCHKECNSSAPWIWKRTELAYMMMTIASQESGFRADVHGGIGMGRGDCAWKYPDGRPAAPGATGARRDSSTCKSVCLGQINVGSGTTSEGWTADDLVGLDYESTKRCMTVTARILAQSRMLCTRWNKTGGNWAKATFAAYGSGSSCTISSYKYSKVDGKRVKQYAYRTPNGIVWDVVPPDDALSRKPVENPWPAKRAAIYVRYYRARLGPSKAMMELMTKRRVRSIVLQLSSADDGVEWLPN